MSDQLPDLLKERDRFVERMRKASRRAEDASDHVNVDDQRELLARYAARLQDATRAKEEAIARGDEEIRHYAGLIRDVESKLARTADGATDAERLENRRGDKARKKTPK